MPRRILAPSLVVAMLSLAASASLAQDAGADSPLPGGSAPEASAEAPEERKGFFHHVLLYLPNRVFDLLDVVRARVRVGPGLAVDARATQVAAAFVGGYATIYAGLPGPRGEPSIPWPVGVETDAGIQVSLAKGRSDDGSGPGYGPTEVGAGFQAALIGLDLGIEPVELLDFALGLVFLDLREDDL